MAKKTNCVINGKTYYRIYRKVGMKLNKDGIWVDDRKAFYGTCKSDAEQKYREYMDRRAKGLSKDNRCLGEMIDEWKDTVFRISPDFANTTKVRYIGVYERILQPARICGMLASEVTAMDMQNFYNESDACYSSMKALNSFLKHFYRYAELNGWCRNITTSLVVPKRPQSTESVQEVEVWEDEEIQVLADEFSGTTMRFLIILAANTGARIGELLALTYDDIHDNMLYITKQSSDVSPIDGDTSYSTNIVETKSACSNRIIPLSKAVMNELEIHKQVRLKEMKEYGYKTNYLFTTTTGTSFYQRNIRRAIVRACERRKINYHKFHALRHTFGTNLSRAGVPIEDTSKLMGHADISTTSKYYIAVSAQKKLDAVEKIAGYTLATE
ncbi:MAG: site-specific integrase [Mogibacterium sp.]|nr:site-specific integrase [Mogibacterium sp.]